MSHTVGIYDGAQSNAAQLSSVPISFINTTGGINNTGGGTVGSGHYLVSISSGQNVSVAAGRAYLPNVNLTMMFSTYLDTALTVPIASNNSGQSRCDYIILYVKPGLSIPTGQPATDAQGAVGIADAQGPVDGSHSPPSPTQIVSGTANTTWTGIGANNPYIVLAQIGTSTGGFIGQSPFGIAANQISDVRNSATFSTGQVVTVPQYEEFTDQSVSPSSPASGKTRIFTIGSNLFLKQPTGPIVQIGSSSLVSNGNAGATPQVDWTLGINQAYTLNVNASFQVFTNGIAGVKGVLFLKQPASGGPTTVTWPSSATTNGIVWPNGVAPTLSTAAGAVDLVGFIYDNTVSRYRGVFQTGYSI